MLSSLRSCRGGPKLWGKKRWTKDAIFCFRRVESSAAPPSQRFKAKQDRWITPTMVLIGAIPVFAFYLGTWQVERLKWKVALVDELEEKLQREPISLPKRVNLSAVPDFAYRKVILKGRWDIEHAILLGPRVKDGANGYHLVVPLVRQDGSTVLVDRGFVKKELADAAKRHLENHEVQVFGMLRTSATRNYFTPDNHPEKGEWYWADVPAIAEHAGGDKAHVQPVLVEEIFEGHGGEQMSRLAQGIPIGRTPTVDVRNSHASYVVTWYSLSAFTAVMFIRLLLKKRAARMRVPR
ncbi:mitochondrial protein required for respiration [Laetiporus sulphureus 93-53]|uniref:SURF1-like protein n=1 Tax=Laetiporus sulphureus 93-53 TaxID=1314785 RepID=A0A165CAP5_9APHY|nr:mitochondrial protein required for respiration [Laetiporus sulphureus 93-53]KZT02471.1 mitochondrial protein required for respiration [Laetiporus sulphureus 93-53]